MLQNRYEFRKTLDHGGMGSVYVAWDSRFNREVAIKTIRDVPDELHLYHFRREIDALSQITHPNIITIHDYGEFLEDGISKPFFVMPLLPGLPLDRVLRETPERLTIRVCTEIAVQAARGLQEAHRRGIIHRDLKPSNLFLLPDNTVQIIDFGVAHLMGSHSSTGPKGTLYYMSPEQILGKDITGASDQFALCVVLYELLTRRRPFDGRIPREIEQSILEDYPPVATELNSAVPMAVSQVLHKGLAKQVSQRFADLQQFTHYFEAASRGDAIGLFDPAIVEPRLQIARQALESNDFVLAANALRRLEAEGFVNAESVRLRKQVDQRQRQERLKSALLQARQLLQLGDLALAAEQVQEALAIDSGNIEAQALDREIYEKQSAKDIESWLQLARQHLDAHQFARARSALESVLHIAGTHPRALQMIAEVEVREEEYNKLRDQKIRAYESALRSWEGGEVSSALERMEAVMELERRAPETSGSTRPTDYQHLFEQVKTTHDAIREQSSRAQQLFSSGRYQDAQEVCDAALTKNPSHAGLRALRVEIEVKQRQELSLEIAETSRRLNSEPDLERQIQILRSALERFPGEPHFVGALATTEKKRDTVRYLVQKARLHEEQQQYAEAISHWEILQRTYPQFSGLEQELSRVRDRRDTERRQSDRQARYEKVERFLSMGEYGRAAALLETIRRDDPDDPSLPALETRVQQLLNTAEQGATLFTAAHHSFREGRAEEGLRSLREAYQLSPTNRIARAALTEALLREARVCSDAQPEAALAFLREAIAVDPNHLGVRTLLQLVDQQLRKSAAAAHLLRATQLQAVGDFEGALLEVDRSSNLDPENKEAWALRETLLQQSPAITKHKIRQHDLDQLQSLAATPNPPAQSELIAIAPEAHLKTSMMRAMQIAGPYAGDAEIEAAHELAQAKLRQQLATLTAPVPNPSLRPPWLDHVYQLRDQLGPNAFVIGGIAIVLSVVFLFASALWLKARIPAQATLPVVVGVITEPPHAAIQVDGKSVGSSPLTISVLPGNHSITASQSGYQITTREVTVSPLTATVSLTLEAQPFELFVVSSEEGGLLLVDGQSVAQSAPGQFKTSLPSQGSSRVQFQSRLSTWALVVTTRQDLPPTIAEMKVTNGEPLTLVMARQGRLRVIEGVMTTLLALGDETISAQAGTETMVSAQAKLRLSRPNSGTPVREILLAPQSIIVAKF